MRDVMNAEIRGRLLDCNLPRFHLFLLFACLFTAALTSQGLLQALLLTWLQVEGMALHFFNNVFSLHLALEAAEGIF